MSTPADAAASRQAATAAASRRLSVETTGIEIIDESERTARPRDLFWPWFAANVSVFGMATASFVLGFGISFAQALAVCVVGVVLSFLLCGLIAVATIVLARQQSQRRRPCVPDRPVDPPRERQVEHPSCHGDQKGWSKRPTRVVRLPR